MPVELIEWFRKVGVYITNGYGMTENCAICSSVDGRDFEKLNTVGKAQKGVELKIDEGTGEILMRGPFVMIGYYKNEVFLILIFLSFHKQIFEFLCFQEVFGIFRR